MTRSFATIVATLLLAGCTGKDAARDSAAIAQAGDTATPAATASRGSFDPATHTATVYAKDFAFEAPDSVTAGLTTIHLVNDGPGLHHVQLVRLDSGKTVADLGAAMKNPGPPPAWAVFVGGPNAVDPGSSLDASVPLTEGNYAMLCLVDVPGHTPHTAKGMVHALTVTAASGTPAPTPNADVTITLADYNFAIKGALTAGKHVIKVENSGPQPHEVELIRLAPGKSMKDVAAWMEKMDGPPPASAVGGVSAMMPAATSYVDVDLAPGNYVLVCFIPDMKDGKQHLEHGMIKAVTVQ